MKIIQLTIESGLSGVYISQVVKPMAELERNGHSVHLIVMPTIGALIRGELRAEWRKRRDEVRRSLRAILTIIPSPPSRFPMWSPSQLLRLWLRRFMANCHETVILHCRGVTAAHYGLRLRAIHPQCRVVFDCRGITTAEMLHRHGVESPKDLPLRARRRYQKVEFYMREGVLRSDSIICVSKAMASYIYDKYDVDRNRLSVIPCLVDYLAYINVPRQREEMRAQLGLSDLFVFVYCGGMASWQRVREIVRLYKKLCISGMRKHFLVLTTAPRSFDNICKEEGLNDNQYTLMHVAQEHVPSYLGAGDMGFLLRDGSLVNRVASPVKFAEYMAAGVPVLMSPEIGDLSSAGLRQGVAAMVPSLEPNKEGLRTLDLFCTNVVRHRDMYAARCRKYACSDLSLKLYSRMVEDAYSHAQA